MCFKKYLVAGFVLSWLIVLVLPAAALADCGLVVIDPGHGGWDSGARGPTGFTEKAANLDISLRVRDLLQQKGYRVVLTRDRDISPNTPPRDLTGDGRINVSDDLQARVNIANKTRAKAFVSIHNNASIAGSARGTETYYWSGAAADSDGARLAGLIQEELVRQTGLYNRGVKSANFYVLRRTDMPAALVEGAFISNPTEELLLKSPDFRQKMATGISNGIKRFIGPSAGAERNALRRTIKPKRRVAINLNNYFCDKSVGQLVTANVPVMAERSIYFNYSGKSGGTNSKGAQKPQKTWFFAEGSTEPNFETWILLANPNAGAVTAKIQLMGGSGIVKTSRVSLPGYGRRSVSVNQLMPNKPLGFRVSATGPIVAERSVYFNYAGRDGGHTSLGAHSTGLTWYFAEGFTGAGFDTWLLLLNPKGTPANVNIKYQTPSGPIDGPSVRIPPRSRRSVHVNSLVSGQEVSAVVTSDIGIVAERSVYFNFNGLPGGHNSVGAKRASRSWYFADGDTRSGFSEFLTIQNPGDMEAPVTVEYIFADGVVATRNHVVAPQSRSTLEVGGPAEAGANRRVAVKLMASVPVVAERPIYFDFNGARGGHDSLGSVSLSRRWYFAEGFTGGGFKTWLVISNPTTEEAHVEVRFFKE